MNVDANMAELATALRTITGLRVHDHRARTIQPPAMLVPLPVITFDETYGRGADSYAYDLALLAGAWSARTSTKRIAGYCAGAGASSVKATLDGYDWTTCHDVHVTTIEFAPVSVAGVEYLAAVFATVVIGSGSS